MSRTINEKDGGAMKEAENEAERIIRGLMADAAFDFYSSALWNRSGYDILNGALMHVTQSPKLRAQQRGRSRDDRLSIRQYSNVD
jgi:hypothetical protein